MSSGKSLDLSGPKFQTSTNPAYFIVSVRMKWESWLFKQTFLLLLINGVILGHIFFSKPHQELWTFFGSVTLWFGGWLVCFSYVNVRFWVRVKCKLVPEVALILFGFVHQLRSRLFMFLKMNKRWQTLLGNLRGKRVEGRGTRLEGKCGDQPEGVSWMWG